MVLAAVILGVGKEGWCAGASMGETDEVIIVLGRMLIGRTGDC